ncbi:MAG: hypothetical protein WCV90_08030 [Candidatus Woesearchaeota archaeon]|jgi:hypothetical protein
MTEPIPLDLIVIYNELLGYQDIFNDSVSPDFVKTGFKVNFKHYSEEELFYPEDFPGLATKNALLYVHGNRMGSHDNFDQVLALSEERPDLKWIVEFDPHSNRDDFSTTESYHRYRDMPHLNRIGDPEDYPKIAEAKILANSTKWTSLFTKVNPDTPLYPYLQLLHQQRSA